MIQYLYKLLTYFNQSNKYNSLLIGSFIFHGVNYLELMLVQNY